MFKAVLDLRRWCGREKALPGISCLPWELPPEVMFYSWQAGRTLLRSLWGETSW